MKKHNMSEQFYMKPETRDFDAEPLIVNIDQLTKFTKIIALNFGREGKCK